MISCLLLLLLFTSRATWFRVSSSAVRFSWFGTLFRPPGPWGPMAVLPAAESSMQVSSSPPHADRDPAPDPNSRNGLSWRCGGVSRFGFQSVPDWAGRSLPGPGARPGLVSAQGSRLQCNSIKTLKITTPVPVRYYSCRFWSRLPGTEPTCNPHGGKRTGLDPSEDAERRRAEPPRTHRRPGVGAGAAGLVARAGRWTGPVKSVIRRRRFKLVVPEVNKGRKVGPVPDPERIPTTQSAVWQQRGEPYCGGVWTGCYAAELHTLRC